jgi:CRP-like cAMP-binding protein
MHAADEVIYAAGDRASNLFVIVEGTVRSEDAKREPPAVIARFARATSSAR